MTCLFGVRFVVLIIAIYEQLTFFGLLLSELFGLFVHQLIKVNLVKVLTKLYLILLNGATHHEHTSRLSQHWHFERPRRHDDGIDEAQAS